MEYRIRDVPSRDDDEMLFFFPSFPPPTPLRSFAFRRRVARSGLLAVPGERYMERRLV